MRTLPTGIIAAAPRSGIGPAVGIDVSQDPITDASVGFALFQVPGALPTLGLAGVLDEILTGTLGTSIAQDSSSIVTLGIHIALEPLTAASIGSAGATVGIVAATVLDAGARDGSAVSSHGNAGNPVGIGPVLMEVAPLPTVLPAIRRWASSFPSVLLPLLTEAPAIRWG